MNLTARFATTMSVAVLLALGVPGCAKEKATEKTVSAPEAPLSKGYETPIAAHATKLSPSSCQCRAGSVTVQVQSGPRSVSCRHRKLRVHETAGCIMSIRNDLKKASILRRGGASRRRPLTSMIGHCGPGNPRRPAHATQ